MKDSPLDRSFHQELASGAVSDFHGTLPPFPRHEGRSHTDNGCRRKPLVGPADFVTRERLFRFLNRHDIFGIKTADRLRRMAIIYNADLLSPFFETQKEFEREFAHSFADTANSIFY